MRNRLSVLVVIGLMAAACGGGEEEPAAVDSEETVDATEESAGADSGAGNDSEATDAGDSGGENTSGNDDAGAGDTTGDNDDTAADDSDAGNDDDGNGDGGNTVSIRDLDDLPSECVEIMGDFLRQIEPLVSGIDWETATLADLEQISEDIDMPSIDIDDEMAAAGCDDFDFDGDDERGFELSIELAEQEAPGVVGWLEFIRSISQDFDATGSSESADGPEDCDGAIAAVRELMSTTDKMTELPVDQLMSASATLQAVTTLCGVDQMTALFDDPEFSDWAG